MHAERELTEIISRDAAAGLAAFQALIAGVAYERKGILFSEMYFFWLCARTIAPRRILESGRARGQSTLILSLCFPDAEILSVEYDRNSPDVAVAAERLQGRSNVQQLFGDATRLLPQMARPGDAVLIDGPKGYRGLRLALRLLADGKTPLVFMHDAATGSQERRFLSRHLPEAVYSDLPAFAEVGHELDRGARDELPQAHRWTAAGAPAAGYGYCLACLPHLDTRDYRGLLLRAILTGISDRLHKTRARACRDGH
jgi:predicted O-methyltransferase YrrM